MPRSAPFIAAVALVVAVAPVAAAAHAYAVSTYPSPGARLRVGPTGIRVTFDEAFTIPERAIRIERAGRPVPCANPPHLDPGNALAMICQFTGPLPRGAYDVRWRAVSDDSHTVHGVFSFGVDEKAPTAAVDAPDWWDPSSPLAVLLRWLALAGALIFAGGSFVAARFADDAVVARRATGIATIALWCCGIGTFAALPLQSIAIGGGFAGTFDAAAVSQALHSTWGAAGVVRAVLLVIAILAGSSVRALALPVLLTFAFEGHAMQFQGWEQILAVGVDFAHFAGASIWLGSVVALAAALPGSLRLVPRVAPFALPGAALVLASGVTAAALHLGAWSDLVTTGYGRIVGTKAILLLVLLALGWMNYRFGRGRGAANVATRTLYAEAIVAVVVVALSAALTGTAPPIHLTTG